jgi:hypothetical protein
MNTSPASPEGVDTDHVPGLDGLIPGQQARARVRGRLEFRAGDGPMITIEPDAQLELERAPQSMVMSWQEEGQPMNAAIPLVQFNEYLEAGLIVIDR